MNLCWEYGHNHCNHVGSHKTQPFPKIEDHRESIQREQIEMSAARVREDSGSTE